jgi:hypothetical protein
MSDAIAGIVIAGIVSVLLALITNICATIAVWIKTRDVEGVATIAAKTAVAANVKVDQNATESAKINSEIHAAVNGQRTALEQKIASLEGVIALQAAQFKAFSPSQPPAVIPDNPPPGTH